MGLESRPEFESLLCYLDYANIGHVTNFMGFNHTMNGANSSPKGRTENGHEDSVPCLSPDLGFITTLRIPFFKSKTLRDLYLLCLCHYRLNNTFLNLPKTLDITPIALFSLSL